MNGLARGLLNWLFPGILLWLLVFAIATFIYSRATAHLAVSGWMYPTSCCSGKDCRQIDDTDIEVRSDGYYIKSSNETIPFTRARPSPDGFYHRCSGSVRSMTYGSANAEGHCFWVPGSV